jgi:chromate transport protein ChrA
MLPTITAILMLLWLLALMSDYTMGGFIHALPVIAIVLTLAQVIQAQRVSWDESE